MTDDATLRPSNARQPTLEELATRSNTHYVPDAVLERLAKASSGTLTMQLF